MKISAEEWKAIRDGLAELKKAGVRAYDNGRDTMAAEIGSMVLDMRRAGAGDGDIVDVVLQVCAARMDVGLPAGDWYQP